MSEMRARWDAASEGWRRWWPRIQAFSQPVSDRLVVMAALEPGHRVLDVASGAGEPALTAARVVGPSGHVVATDLSPAMLAGARERAREEGLTNVETREADAETLDVQGPFDAVLCRWGLMFVADIDRAFRRMHELLVPGGRVAFAVWRRNEQFEITRAAADRVVFDLPPAPVDPLRFADPQPLLDALHAAGFGGIETDDVPTEGVYESAEDYVEFALGISSALRAALAERPGAEPDLRAAMAEEARKHPADGDGIRIRGVSICIGARTEGAG
jgi:SAM-dependent methyltransferase